MCIILSGSLRDWWNVNVRTIIPITESENIDVCSVLTQCLPGVEVPSQYISMHLSLPIPPHYFFSLLMNKILKCGVCFQKRGMKNYCVDTWLVSLPPTLALSDNTPGCPPPFEMLMGFLNVLLQNSPPPPHLHLSSILFASFPCPQHCLSARFLHDLAPPFQQAAVCFLAV